MPLCQKAGLTLLQEKGVWIDDSVYLYGRPDYERPGRGITKRKTPKEITKNIDKSKPIIVLEHEPRQLQELADAGVDAQLCGHTHDGQMFPGNLTIKLLWENAYGTKRKMGCTVSSHPASECLALICGWEPKVRSMISI